MNVIFDAVNSRLASGESTDLKISECRSWH